MPLRSSLSDIRALMTCASWAVWRVIGANDPPRAGPFGWAVAAYALVFVIGTVIGAARGGAWDPIVALAEARGGLHFCLLYFLTAYLVR